MTLAKKAAGLPRFMLDCGWWRSPKWRGVSLDEMGLFAACVSYCHEHATDGLLPSSDDEELAMALGLREREVRKAKAALLKRGRLEHTGRGLELRGYTDHNPTRKEIEDDRARRTAAAVKANHTRHHVERNRSDPDCPLCPPPLRPASDSEGRSESDSDSTRAPEGMEGMEWNGCSSSSSSVTGGPPRSTSPEEEFASGVIEALAERDYRGHSGHVGNHAAYRQTCAENRRKAHWSALVEAKRAYPDLTVAEGCTLALTGLLPVRHRDQGVELPPPATDDERERAKALADEARRALRATA